MVQLKSVHLIKQRLLAHIFSPITSIVVQYLCCSGVDVSRLRLQKDAKCVVVVAVIARSSDHQNVIMRGQSARLLK